MAVYFFLSRAINMTHLLCPLQEKNILKNCTEKPLSDIIIHRIVHQPDRKCHDVEPITVQTEAEAVQTAGYQEDGKPFS